MTHTLKKENDSFFSNLTELCSSIKNRENPTFSEFTKKYGKVDNVISFKKTLTNFLGQRNILFPKIEGENFMIKFWQKQGYFHESLLREWQQKEVLFKFFEYLLIKLEENC